MDFLNRQPDASHRPTFYARRGPVGRTLIEALALLIVCAGLGVFLASLPFGNTFLASEANVNAIGTLLGAPPNAPAAGRPFDGDVQRWLEEATESPVPHSNRALTPPANPLPNARHAPGASVNLGLLVVGLMVGVLIFPVAEELIFRGLPLLGLRALQRRAGFDPQRPVTVFGAVLNAHWLIGGLAASVFAVLHGIGDGVLHFPLPQFVAGLAFWWVALHRGLRYSMLMHATYNIVPLGLLALSVAVN